MVTFVIYITLSMEGIHRQSNGQPRIKISSTNCDNPKIKTICRQTDITVPDMSD
jgi:hypothetical protein